MKSKKVELIPIIILITISLLVGTLTIHDYGESWDEYNFYSYAEESIAAYEHFFSPRTISEFHDPTLRYYGPWFLMLIVQTAKLFPNWIISDIGHLSTFILFQLGIATFYFLARRWFKPWTAFGAALLFATQPLFWGHAFINSRDIPFMVGFIAIIYFGLRMGDALPKLDILPRNKSKVDILAPARTDFNLLPLWMRLLIPIITLLGLIALGILATYLSNYWLTQGLPDADTSSARDFDLYLRPILAKFWGGMAFFFLSILLLSGLYLPFMPALRKHIWEVDLRPTVEIWQSLLIEKKLLIASLVLGLTIATRIMGFAAAGLVGVILIIRYYKKLDKEFLFHTFLLYALLALPIIYITWPYIWGEPILRLSITLKVMSSFPWPGKVLYSGSFYEANQLPWHYLPKLFSFQLTEPLLILSLIGFLFTIYQVFIQKKRSEFFLLTTFWFFLPLAAAIFGSPYLYDNFRQMFFVLPPLFLWAGAGIELLFAKIDRPLYRGAVLLALVIPGIFVGIRLHPYEYIYYNSFAGGTDGASRQYEIDYWGTAFRETAAHLNEIAEPNADVVVWGPATVAWRYARPDLKIYDARAPELIPDGNYYAMISSRGNNDLEIHPDIAPLYTLQHGEVVLAVIKYVE